MRRQGQTQPHHTCLFAAVFLILSATLGQAQPGGTWGVQDAPGEGAPAIPATASPAGGQGRPLSYTGVSIAGGDFDHPAAGKKSPYGIKYIYPSSAELTYFASRGVNIIRLPFHWENVQPELKQPLDPADLGRLKTVVTEATSRGMVVLLDPHNYARYHGKIIGGADVSDDAFADFWGKLASEFRDNPRVWFGLMNEPFGIAPKQWVSAVNAAIDAIRRTGAKNLLLVPGVAWTGAHSWVDSGNATEMLHVQDPEQHYVFEVHQYLDTDSSGSKPDVVSATIGSERLRQFTLWCREHHQQGFLGEFAVGNTDLGRSALEDMLGFMEKNRDVWVGYTWWAAGAWWGDYMFAIEPKNGVDAPLLGCLKPHLQRD